MPVARVAYASYTLQHSLYITLLPPSSFLHEERATASLHLGSAYAPGFFFCGLTAFRSMPFARSSAIVCETFIRLSKPFCCS